VLLYNMHYHHGNYLNRVKYYIIIITHLDPNLSRTFKLISSSLDRLVYIEKSFHQHHLLDYLVSRFSSLSSQIISLITQDHCYEIALFRS